MATGYSPKIVTDGLVLALDAGNTKSYPGSGTTWYDRSGNNYDSTLYGTTSYADGALDLGTSNHTTNYILLPDEVMSGITNFTVSLWLYPHNIDQLSCVWHASVGGGNDFSIEWFPTYIQTLFTVTYSTFNWTRTDGEWYNIVFNRNGSNMGLHINGVSFGTQTCPTTTLNITGAIVLGQEQDAVQGGFSATQCYKGKYSHVTMYNQSLETSEIQQNYNALKGRFGL